MISLKNCNEKGFLKGVTLGFFYFVLSFIVLIVSRNVYHWYDSDTSGKFVKFLYRNDDTFLLISGMLAALSTIAVGSMLFVIITNHVTAPATVACYNETYKALTYKLESKACRDEFGLLSKSVVDEVQKWNENIATKKHQQSNSWIGIFVPNIYDQFNTIDFTGYKR